MRWAISGRTAATAATANNTGAVLWNVSTTRTIWVTAVAWTKTVATADVVALKRVTGRGTQTTTSTPTIASDYERELSPPSGALLDLAWSAQPAVEGVEFFRYGLPAAIASGFILPLETKDVQGIKVLPVAGLALLTPVATILQPADAVFFVFE